MASPTGLLGADRLPLGVPRIDKDLSAQGYTATQKGILIKNTLSLWERIGDPVIASNVATVSWNNLADYRALRLSAGNVIPATSNVSLYTQTSTDNGATWVTSATYVQQFHFGTGTTVGCISTTDSGARLTIEGQGNASQAYSLSATSIITEFNVASSATRFNTETSFLIPSSSLEVGKVAANRGAAAVDNALRLIYSSGNIATGWFILEGIRG